MTSMRWTFVTLLSLSITACGESEAERESRQMQEASPQRARPDGAIQLTQQDREALALVVVTAAESDLPDSTVRFGQVMTPPANEARIVAPVTGRIRRAPFVQLGAVVAVGAPIVEIVPVLDAAERISAGTQAAQRQGEIEAAERDLARAEAEAARARQLAPQVISAAKLQEAETVAAMARARLEALRQARTVQTQEESAPVFVRAPISGRVVALSAEVAAPVRGGDVLARILRPGSLWIDVVVPPDEVPGDRYEVVLQTRTIPAQFLARGSVTEADGTRRDRLLVNAADAGTLVPGAAVSVRVGRGATRGVVLPDAAIVPGIDADFVYIEAQAGLFVPRPVRVAARFGHQVRVASGVQPKERVVVQGAMALQGEAVRSQLRPSG